MFEAIDTKTDALRRSGQQRLERKDALSALKRALDAEWIFQEMAVSGRPLARMDVRRMIEIKNQPQTRLQVLIEAYNFHKAVQFIERHVARAPRDCTEAELVQAHVLLLVGLDDNAGRFREADLKAADVGVAIPGAQVAPAIQELFQWLRSSSHQHPIRQATEMQLRLLFSQPFTMMNARTARLMSSLVLMQRGLPPALLTGDDRASYAEAVARAPKDGGWALAHLLAAAVERSLDFCLETIERTPVVVGATNAAAR